LLVDSHCHLNYLEAPQNAVARARASGVAMMVCIAVNADGIDQVLDLASRYEDVWATAGQHPEAAAAPWDWIEPYLDHPRVLAVGETGLDYYQVTDAAARRRQQHCFAAQLELAVQRDLPVVVHTRSAEADTLALLRDFPGVRGVLHCFTESWAMAEAALAEGFYISISGIVTFKNAANVRAVAERVPADRLLVETDSPWLAPEPHRGKANEPAYVCEVASRVAQLRGVPAAQLHASTGENFLRLFQRASAGSSSSS
jgi:TatD DNase family protein